MANNFKVFADTKVSGGTTTVMSDSAFNSSTERQNGSVPHTVIKSDLNNTALREATLLSTALIDAIESLDTRTNPGVTYSPNDTLSDFKAKLIAAITSFTKTYADTVATNAANTEKTRAQGVEGSLQTSVTNLENSRVSFTSSQSLTDAQKTQARANIGSGTSNFSGSYNDLGDKPKFYNNFLRMTGTFGSKSLELQVQLITTSSSITSLADVLTNGTYYLSANGYITDNGAEYVVKTATYIATYNQLDIDSTNGIDSFTSFSIAQQNSKEVSL